MDAADVTGALLLELVLPISLLLCSRGNSCFGIIAVVVAGISLASRFKKSPFLMPSWIVFLIRFGEPLPSCLMAWSFSSGDRTLTLAALVLRSTTYDNLWMLLAIVLLTATMFGIRFVMISAVFAQRAWRAKRSLKKSGRVLLF